MTKISALAIGALLALSTVALARAEEPVTGIWKLSIGVTRPLHPYSFRRCRQASTAGAVTPVVPNARAV